MISIIMPAYNEEKRIGNTLDNYGKFFEKKLQEEKIKDFEIIVVLNGCKDRTLNVVKKAGRKFKEIRHLEFEKSGKGFAILEGFKEALKTGELIGFVDADLATSPEEFYKLVKGIENYGGVIASRWMKNSIIKTPQTFLRKLMSRGFNFIVRSVLFLPYSDTQCGAKLFKKKALKEIVEEIELTKWAFDIALLYKLKKKGFKIKEIPTVWNDKKGSKLEVVKVPFQMFSSVIRLRFIYSPFKFIVRVYDKLPEKMKIHNL